MRNGAETVAWAEKIAREMLDTANEEIAAGETTVGEIALGAALFISSIHHTTIDRNKSLGIMPPRYFVITQLANDEYISRQRDFLLDEYDTRIAEEKTHSTPAAPGECPVDAPEPGAEGPAPAGESPSQIGGQPLRVSPWNIPRVDGIEGGSLEQPDATPQGGAQGQDTLGHQDDPQGGTPEGWSRRFCSEGAVSGEEEA